MHVKLLQSCLTLWDPMECSPPGSSVHGILQARILEWVAMPPPPGDLPDPGIKLKSLIFPAAAGGFFTTSATWEVCVYVCVCVCIYIIKYNYIIVGAQRKETTCPNLIVKTRTGSCMACSWETKIRVCHWNHRVHHVQ